MPSLTFVHEKDKRKGTTQVKSSFYTKNPTNSKQKKKTRGKKIVLTN